MPKKIEFRDENDKSPKLKWRERERERERERGKIHKIPQVISPIKQGNSMKF